MANETGQSLVKVLILKFGGAAVAAPSSFARVAEIIAERREEGHRLVVVVSAMGKMTEELIDLALQVHPSPPKREKDMLVSVGERISISLLAMALDRKKIPAISFTGSQSGIITTSEHSDAQIIDMRPFRVKEELNKGKVVIIAGFQGVSREKEITTLGRGGSDTSAVALAIALNAEKVEFYKDVQGIYAKDPKIDPEAEFFPELTYDKALEIGGKVLHKRALDLAKKNNIPLEIKSFHKDSAYSSISSGKRKTVEKYEGTCVNH